MIAAGAPVHRALAMHSATAAATCGAAMLVPDSVRYPPPGGERDDADAGDGEGRKQDPHRCGDRPGLEREAWPCRAELAGRG
jgi:hypothetical protein